MRNLFAPVLAVVGLLMVTAPVAAQAPTKIGYLDSRRVIQEAPGAQAARETIEREMQAAESELQTLEDSLQSMITDYQQKQPMMSAEARQQREQQIRTDQQTFQQRMEQLQQQIGQRQQEIMAPIMQRVEQAISELRQADGYAVIFDIASEAIVSADPSLDVTARVIERLREASPAATRDN